MSKKVISYSLYGSKPFYCEGAIQNAKEKVSNYGPEWETWFYVYEDVPKHYVDELKQVADRVIPITRDFPVQNGTMWRFLAIDEPEVEIMLIRDIDSRPIEKEKKLVEEWLISGKQYHIIRDAPTHQMPFLACSFGIRKGNKLSIIELLSKNPHFMKKSNMYIIDQLFLAHCIYPLTVNNRLVHDSFNHYELDGWNSLERTDRFIGEKILEDGTPDGQKELDAMNDRFIYFHRNVDLYKTEQFGAFLYEFMEHLQIARKLGRTLVIPNVYIAPRNNEKIFKEKHIYLKSLSLVPITEYLNLTEIDKRYVRLLPLSEFYEKTYDAPALALFNPDHIDLSNYIINKRLITPFGHMHIKELFPMKSFGLHVIGLMQNADFNKLNANVQNLIVIENGRLGQPNWHAENLGLDYFWIRMSIEFKTKYQMIADKYVLENNIRTKSTLLFHWRSGDYTLVGKKKNKYEKYEDETHQYMENYTVCNNVYNIIANVLEIKQKNMEIEQLFLVTNHTIKEDIDFISCELSKFNIRIVQFQHENQQKEGMIQQLIGAQCKYQLHGPTQYERMSAFGRWMIEERKRYYFNEHYITTMEVFNHVYFLQKLF
jgi:hypothetical protein